MFLLVLLHQLPEKTIFRRQRVGDALFKFGNTFIVDKLP